MSGISYLNFDLQLQRAGDGSTYRLLAESPTGETVRATFEMPFSDLELENFTLRAGPARRGVRRADTPEVDAAKRFGDRLYSALFTAEVRAAFQSSLDQARQRGESSRGRVGVRVRLRLTDVPELAGVPWEYMYNAALNRFLALSTETPVVRYLDLPERIRPLKITPPLRLLVMIAGPSDYARLDVRQEWLNLNTALSDLVQHGLVQLDLLEEPTLAGLQRQLRRVDYHIFHFIGHGAFDRHIDDGLLVFEDEEGRGRMVTGQELAMLLHDHPPLRLAVLNACEGAQSAADDPFSGVAQSLVQGGLPAVIAMQFEITDRAAIVFAHEFYRALADGYTVDASLAEARKVIFTDGRGSGLEWGTPVLHMRSPDGKIFNLQKRAEVAEEPQADTGPLPIRGSELPDVPPVAPSWPSTTSVSGPLPPVEATDAAEAGAANFTPALGASDEHAQTAALASTPAGPAQASGTQPERSAGGEAAAATLTGATREATREVQPSRPRSRVPLLVAAVAVVALLIIAGGLFALNSNGSPVVPTPTQEASADTGTPALPTATLEASANNSTDLPTATPEGSTDNSSLIPPLSTEEIPTEELPTPDNSTLAGPTEETSADAESHYRAGITAFQSGDAVKAIAEFSEAIRLQPDYDQAYLARGYAYRSKDMYDEAITDLTRSIELAPDNSSAYYERGTTYAYQGDYEAALKDLTEAIYLQPNLIDAYYLRGVVYLETYKYDDAIDDFSEVLDKRPSDSDSYYRRGLAYAGNADYEAAVNEYNRAIEVAGDRNHDSLVYARAEAYRELGDDELAIADYQTVVEITDDDTMRSDAEQRLKDLQGN